MAAVEAGVDIVPVAIRDARNVLRGEQWFPRHGHIVVEIGEPIAPQGKDFHAAVQLRATTRAWILKHCGEADLAQDDVDLAAWDQL